MSPVNQITAARCLAVLQRVRDWQAAKRRGTPTTGRYSSVVAAIRARSRDKLVMPNGEITPFECKAVLAWVGWVNEVTAEVKS